MIKIVKNSTTIEVTEKAFEVIYKPHGFKKIEDAPQEIKEEIPTEVVETVKEEKKKKGDK